MPKKTVGPRISEKTATWYETNFATRGTGAEFILEAFPMLYKRALGELNGKFTANELSLLIDTYNSTGIHPSFLGQGLELSAHDSMALDHTDEKWNVDRESLLTKIKALSLFDQACLEIWLRAFWESGEWEKDGGLEKWVAQIA
jgi:hypothetical protein